MMNKIAFYNNQTIMHISQNVPLYSLLHLNEKGN